jgi:hypothetical protein
VSYCTDTETLVSRKEHRCTWCAQVIAKGETYKRWVSFDDSAYTNKMHPECESACNEECREWGENEYTAYQNERPPAASGLSSTEQTK